MRAWPWIMGGAIQVGLVVWTAFGPWTPGLGVPTWHHNAALAVSLAFAAAFWRRMTTDRRFLGLGVMVTTILAVASAFLLLYLKQDLKDSGLKDWAKFWHVAWSWFALWFFLGHTWVNRRPFVRAVRRVGAGLRGLATYWLPHLLVLAAIPLTWAAWGAREFTDPRYIPMTLWTWMLFLAPSYLVWLWAALRIRRQRRPTWATRPAAGAFVDAWLVPMTFWANVTGFPILYFGTKDTALKYVAKYWHTWPSIAMAILVFAHTVQFWPGVRRYAAAAQPPESA